MATGATRLVDWPSRRPGSAPAQCAPRPARLPSSAELARRAPSVPRCALPSAFRRPPRLATRPFAGAASHGPNDLDAALTAAGGARHAQPDGPQDGRERRPRPSEGSLRRVSARRPTVGKTGRAAVELRGRRGCCARGRRGAAVVPLNVAGGKPRGRGTLWVSIALGARAVGRCCCAPRYGRSWLGTLRTNLYVKSFHQIVKTSGALKKQQQDYLNRSRFKCKENL